MRANDLFGEPTAKNKGNMMHHHTLSSEKEHDRKQLYVSQVLFNNVLAVAGHDFLLSLIYPLQLTIIMELVNLDAESSIIQIQNHIKVLGGEHYDVIKITTDRQASFNTFEAIFLVYRLKRVELDIMFLELTKGAKRLRICFLRYKQI